MKVMTRRCPWTQKLFEDDALYSKHLGQLREQHRLTRYWPTGLEQGNQAIQWATQNVTSCNQFEHWFQQNWTLLVIRGTWISSTRPIPILRLDQMPVPELKTVKLQLTYNPCIPNTHCCPLGEVQNFRQHPELPRGYPGWTGNLTWSFDPAIRTKAATGSDLLARSVIHTGTGWGIRGECSYAITLWASDWPGWSVWHALVSS